MGLPSLAPSSTRSARFEPTQPGPGEPFERLEPCAECRLAELGQSVRPTAVIWWKGLDQAAALEAGERAAHVPGPIRSPPIASASTMIA